MYTYEVEFVDRKVCNLEKSVSLDQNLLIRAKAGDQTAYVEILEFFTPLLRMITSSYFLIGGDREDLFQEGCLGLYGAVCSYEAEKNDNFIKYAKICIHRALLSAVKRDSRLKNASLNTSIPLSDAPELKEMSAEDIVLGRERLVEVYEKIEDKLTDREHRVLSLFVDGNSYKEIAEKLGINAKAVDNALTRIRGKLQ
ncbi:MAG: sigma-70 family RNA polymerase sigma factor [Clostridia bacterium]|nr:sigma-70 family RNA polymerase sigma factor [Clostridia bacterium]